MEHTIMEFDDFKAENGARKKAVEEREFDDKEILALAKRRIAAKRNIIGQILDYVLLVIAFSLLVFIYDGASRFVVGFIVCAFWGIRLFVRVIKYAKPSFRDGIRAYFKNRDNAKLETEYLRLKCVKVKDEVTEGNL